MANHNNGHLIVTAINSVLAQTLHSWELIIVDDCSTDNSVAVIEELIPNEERIKFLKNDKNRGVGYTKHRAVAECHGDLVGILDPDDALHENALAIMSLAHAENPTAALCWSDYWLCDAELKPIEKSTSIFHGDNNMGYMLAQPGDIHHFWCFKRSSYSKTKGFMVSLRLAEDQDLFYKLEEVGATHNVNETLYYYRHHSGSTSIGENTANAFAYHLIVMCAALRRRMPLLPIDIWLQQCEAVCQQYDNFFDWGATGIDVLLAAQLQRSISSVCRPRKVKSVFAKALKYQVKNLLTDNFKRR